MTHFLQMFYRRRNKVLQGDTVHRFVEYASGVSRRMGDRISAYTTHNEPWVIATLGYDKGIFAPGIQSHAQAAQASPTLLITKPSVSQRIIVQVFLWPQYN